jgi:hypothetical protein
MFYAFELVLAGMILLTAMAFGGKICNFQLVPIFFFELIDKNSVILS